MCSKLTYGRRPVAASTRAEMQRTSDSGTLDLSSLAGIIAAIGAQMLELSQNGNHQSGQHQDGRWKFDEVTKMWSAMSEEEKHAYTEDFKVREARICPFRHCRLDLRRS